MITLLVFTAFSILYLRESFKWNYAVGFGLILLAVFFVFHDFSAKVPAAPSPIKVGVSSNEGRSPVASRARAA